MHFLIELIQAIGLGLAIILPLANPVTTVALFLGLSQGMSKEEMNREAMMASVYVFMIMMVAFYAGQLVMSTFGISIPGLRIAGGMIVAFIGFKMLFPVREAASDMKDIVSKDMQKHDRDSIAFIPLAMPSTAGPGTIAMIISGAATIETQYASPSLVIQLAPACIFLSVAVILWICLRSARLIMKALGKGGVEAFSRLMGFLLVCIGVQFIINGVFELMETMPLKAL